MSDSACVNSSAKSRSLVASMLFARRRVEAELGRDAFAVQRQNRSCHCSRAERTDVQPLAAVGQPIEIAQKHLDVRQQPVRHQHRLRPLHMRVRRHGRVAGGFRLVHELADELAHLLRDGVDLRAYVQAQIGGNLFVAAAAGVQLVADFAGKLHQPRFDVVMDVFDGRIVSRGHALGRDLVERAQRGLRARHAVSTPALASADACALLAATSYGSRMRSNGNDRCHCSKSAFSSWLKRPDHIFICRHLQTSRPQLEPASLHPGAFDANLRHARFHQRTRARRQAQNADETFRVLLVVAGAHGEAGDVRTIERRLRLAAGDVDVALVQRERDRAVHVGLRARDERLQRFAQRREP